MRAKIRITETKHDRNAGEMGPASRFYLGVVESCDHKIPKNVAINGFMTPLTKGVVYEFDGDAETSNKGTMFKAKKVHELVEYDMDFSSFEKILRDICKQANIKGLLGKDIESCFEEYGSDSFSALEDDHTATRFFRGKGIEVAEAVRQKRGIGAISTFLTKHGFNSLQIKNLLKRFHNKGGEIKKMLESDPYKMAILRIPFVGFKTIDSVALSLSKDSEALFSSMQRIKAGIMYIVDNATEMPQRHCYLTNRQLFSIFMDELGFRAKIQDRFIKDNGLNIPASHIGQAINASPSLKKKYNDVFIPFKTNVKKAIDDLLEASLIKKRVFLDSEGNEFNAYYSPKVYHMENYVARRIKAMSSIESDLDVSAIKKALDGIIDADKANGSLSEWGLTEEQYNACVNAMRYRFSVLTGSAGTGKTLTTKYIVKLFSHFGVSNPIICAPTGKAADRASKVTGLQGGTIHRILGYRGEKFTKNETDPLETDLALSDESSMVDLHLFYRLLLAIGEDTHLILIGDPNQLPSVGAGYILGDIISAGINVSRLTKVFRQGEGSLLDFVDDVRQQIMPKMANCLADGFDWSNKPQVVGASLTEMQEKGIKYEDFISDFLTDIVPNVYGYSDYQSLTAMKAGDYQSEYNNRFLRGLLNSTNFLEYTISSESGIKSFKAGDRVIHTVNNPMLGAPDMDKALSEDFDMDNIGVFNGEVGVVRYVEPEEGVFSVEYPNGKGGTKVLQYAKKKDQFQVEQAWNITVHKSQGSEYEVVILVLPKSSAYMMDRTLLYTGATRASKLLLVIYDELNDGKSIIEYSLSVNKAERRNTGLEYLLADNADLGDEDGYIDNDDEEQ